MWNAFELLNFIPDSHHDSYYDLIILGSNDKNVLITISIIDFLILLTDSLHSSSICLKTVDKVLLYPVVLLI